MPAPSWAARSTRWSWKCHGLRRDGQVAQSGDLCDKNQVWSTGWRQLRAGSDDDFREADEKANELQATGHLFVKHIELEPVPADP